MKNINRRNWLKISSLAGTGALISGTNNLQAMTNITRPIKGTADQPIRLSSNENPYGPSPKVRQAMTAAFDTVCRYPYSWYKELIDMLHKKHGV